MLRAVKGLAVMMMLGMLMTAGYAAEGAQATDAPLGQQRSVAKRLILTDGSYQVATEWKKIGDRVRYFSAERGEWEEVPVALVDWKATDEWNSEREKSAEEASKEMKQVTAEEVAARKDEQLNTPLVAPGWRLPAQGGVFLLEEAGGKPVLQKMEGNSIQVNGNEGKTLLKRSIIPIASQTETVELKGAAAKLRVHSKAPSFFLDVENDQGPIAGDNFRIVRLEKKKNLRVLAKSKVGIEGVESVTEKFLLSRAEKFSGDWWKLIPLEDLTPGEYGIVSAVAGQDTVVWDFGVEK
jgi:hypothetical protein